MKSSSTLGSTTTTKADHRLESLVLERSSCPYASSYENRAIKRAMAKGVD